MQFFHFPPEYKEIRVLQEQPGRRLVLLENQKRKQKLLWRCSDRGNGDVYESLCEIEHPNLRPVYDVCSEGNEVEVLEEYLEGEPAAHDEKSGRETGDDRTVPGLGSAAWLIDRAPGY